jgi:hypothetical protein
MIETLLIMFWIAEAIAISIFAEGRGSSGLGWFVIGLMFGPIGFAMIFIDGQACHYCRKHVSAKALVCPYCRTTFEALKEGT